MPANPIAAVLIHVADVPAGIAWYTRAFPEAIRKRLDEVDFEYLQLGSIQIEIVPADAKVASGAAGSVVYWQVPDFDAALEHMLSIGATLYRGPIQIEDSQRMCQVRDPWGNCIGLRGGSKAGNEGQEAASH